MLIAVFLFHKKNSKDEHSTLFDAKKIIRVCAS